MTVLSKEDRIKRDARELGNWEGRRMQGEARQREDRRVEAVKAKEDGVSPRGQRQQDRETVVLRA